MSLIEAPACPPDLPDSLQRQWGALLGDLVDRRGEGLAVKELGSGVYLMVNERLVQWWGQPAAALVGHTDADIFSAADLTALRAADQAAIAHGTALASEHRFEWSGQRREFGVLRSVSEPDAAGRRWLVSLWSDLAPARTREHQLRHALDQIEQQQVALDGLRQELKDQALRDPASSLYTRAHFDERLRREVDLSTREHREFAIVFAELHAAGEGLPVTSGGADRARQAAMGRLLRGGTRAMDSSCRWDDKRFAVLLSGVGLATAHARMETLRRRCEHEIVVHAGQEVRFTVAMGVASFPHTAQSQTELVSACEAALAEALRRGGNRVTLAAIRLAAL